MTSNWWTARRLVFLLSSLLILVPPSFAEDEPEVPDDPNEREEVPLLEYRGPICNYLNRGFDDHLPGRADRYAVTPHGPSTLADIHHLKLGLDLPETHCEDNPHAVPCADHDDPQSWCVRRLGLSVLGIHLFDTSEPNGCLLRPQAGTGGSRTISGFELRQNPLWGFTPSELETLVAGFDPVTANFRPPSLRFSSDYLGRLFEGLVGDGTARQVKGCANKLYCGNKRGRLVDQEILPFWTIPRDVDCDLGGCPPLGQRSSSPWVELRGEGDHVRVDLDLEIDRGKPDFDDHAHDGSKQLPYYGTTYRQLFHGHASFDLSFQCRRHSKVGDGKSFPLCSEAPGEICFQPGPVLGSEQGKIKCPPGNEDPLCGTTLPYKPDHALQVAVEEFSFENEAQGLHGKLVELAAKVGCSLVALFGEGIKIPIDDETTIELEPEDCSLEAIIGLVGQGILDQALVGFESYKGLDRCPLVTYEPNGAVEIDFLSGASEGPQEQAAAIPAVDRQRDFAKTGAETRRSTSDPTGGPAGLSRRDSVSPGQISQLALGLGETLPAEVTDDKIPMAQLDQALQLICALAKSCPGIDLSSLPIQDLAGLDAGFLQGLSPDSLADPAVVEQLQELFGPLLEDPKFRQCVGDNDNPLIFLGNLLQWLELVFQPNLEAGSCAGLQLEALFPLLGLELLIETAESPVGDTFAFVDFGFWTKGLQKQYGCRARPYYPTSEAPVCDGGVIVKGPEGSLGEACGTVPGGPCHDIRGPSNAWTRSEPEDAGFHPNGDFLWHTRCGHDLYSGRQMVCVEEFYPGSGVNRAGVCKICGEDGEGGQGIASRYTTIGCKPETTCPEGQFLATDGRCWNVDGGVPEWECEADCETLLNGYGWCVHHGPWRSWMQLQHPDFADHPSSYHRPICAEHTSCQEKGQNYSGVECAAVGKVCQPDTGTCEIECIQSSDCQEQKPAPAYPEGFVCIKEPQTCRLEN